MIINGNYRYGIFVKTWWSSQIKIISNELQRNVIEGIVISDGSTYEISHNQFIFNGIYTTSQYHSIFMSNSSFFSVLNNTFYANHGILVDAGSHHCTIERNRFHAHDVSLFNDYQIRVIDSNFLTIQHNLIQRAADFGIWITNSNNTNLLNNSIHNNEKVGMYIDKARHGVISENYVNHATFYGIGVLSAFNMTINKNKVHCSTVDGVFFPGTCVLSTKGERHVQPNSAGSRGVQEALPHACFILHGTWLS